jgi:hypothetical protein
MIAEVPPNHDIVIDFYVFHSARLGDPESTQQEVRAVLSQAGFPRSIRRIVATAAGTGHGQGMAGMHFTYRPSSENTYEEEKLYRGIHPMMGKRLHLWRLSNFKIDRLPSVEAGRIVQLPHLERMLMEAMASIRLFQSRRPTDQRLHWNRILLNVWPPFNLGRDECAILYANWRPRRYKRWFLIMWRKEREAETAALIVSASNPLVLTFRPRF